MQNPNLSPMVTILLPFYNERKYIKKAILSVLQQNYSNWELILLDDASTDGTLHEIRKILKMTKRIEDKRIIYHRFSTNRGKVNLLNDGLDLAQGEYILELDGDDWLHPHAIGNFLNGIENQSEQTAMLYSDYITLTKKRLGKKVKWSKSVVVGRPVENLRDLINNFFVPTPRFYRKNALIAVGGWPTDYPSYGRLYEDVAVILKLLQKYQIAYLPKVTMFVRKHSDSITKSNQKAWFPLFKFLTAKYTNSIEVATSDKNQPLVTIIIPFQNQAKYLSFLLESLNYQHYKNIELQFVNDHSSDESQTIINNFSFPSFIKYKIISLKDVAGEGNAIRRALGEATGTYFMVCSPYEVLYPEALSILVHSLEQEENRLAIGAGGRQRMFQSFPSFKFMENQENRPILYRANSFKESYWKVECLSEGVYFSEWFNRSQAFRVGGLITIPQILSIHIHADSEKIKEKIYEPVKNVLSQKIKKQLL